uniref:protein-tyrosine-phosphatase n=1 Tax=Arcella intermedia TaxID=1963864 RepID=A0A6B2LK81_9EUKA|eukprot:TRINITY_DN8901_c0_g1_i1.p1 TRINITY_DN8901_c0_g1~~TRINITY_DN8901_c0_g1_i1.p1  ORF type:complete len:195 (-),score=37.42 TRINITY_DN8901_c0_g1_i1:75-659(-)
MQQIDAIYPNKLYLSGIGGILRKGELDARQIGVIVSVTFDKGGRQFEDKNYHYFPIEDNPEADIFDIIPPIHTIIDTANAEGKSVLIHCTAGVSRSASVVISYVMKTERMSFENALKFVKKKRLGVSPNWGFMYQLIEYENQILPDKPSEQKHFVAAHLKQLWHLTCTEEEIEEAIKKLGRNSCRLLNHFCNPT